MHCSSGASKPDIYRDDMQTFGLYLAENTPLLYYKDHPVNAV
jgi:hypothetical protein